MIDLELSLCDLARDKPAAADAIAQAVLGAALVLDAAARFGPGNALRAALVSLRTDLLKALPADDVMQVLDAIAELDTRVGSWPRGELDPKRWQRSLAGLAGQLEESKQ